MSHTAADPITHRFRFDDQPVYTKDPEKGKAEPATQVQASLDQRADLEIQRTRTQASRQTQRSRQTSTTYAPVSEEEEHYDKTSSGPPSGIATPDRRRIDAFAPNNTPVGNITDQNLAEPDPNQKPHNWWASIRTKYGRVLAEFLGESHDHQATSDRQSSLLEHGAGHLYDTALRRWLCTGNADAKDIKAVREMPPDPFCLSTSHSGRIRAQLAVIPRLACNSMLI